MDPPEWLQEGAPIAPPEQVDHDSHLPEWLREATKEQPEKKPKKKLAYKAPARRDSSDRSSFSGPIPDPIITYSNPGITLLSNNSKPPGTAPVSTSIFSPQRQSASSMTYQSISMEEDAENGFPSSSSRRHSKVPNTSTIVEDEDSADDDASRVSPVRHTHDDSVDALTWWFRLFHSVSGLSATICVVGNAYDVTQWQNSNIRGAVLHLYAAVFSLLIVAVECEVPFLMHRLKIMEWWVVRGLLYIFVGCLTIDPTNDAENPTKTSVNMSFMQNIAGGILCAIAILYIIMGLLCMKQIRDRKLAHMNIPSLEITF